MQAFLILCHRPLPHLPLLAQRFAGARFYVHCDAKAAVNTAAMDALPNVRVLHNRVAVYWGGFSVVMATLNLIQAALAERRNDFFHLMSGDCVPLPLPETLARETAALPRGSLLLESAVQRRLRYRVRFNLPHADTAWQRSVAGKILTKCAQAADWLLPFADPCLAGSQWFSADRAALQRLFDASLGDRADFFAKKPVPDEHFFQDAAAELSGSLNHIADNRRFIRFAARANHPDWLDLDELYAARRQGFWFARKVAAETALRFLAEDGR